jgi:pyridoxal 5'-phosphate synthase pdxT subunit
VTAPTVGVLALQGDVREHFTALAAAGARPVAVRRPEELAEVDGLVVPGGESTTITLGVEREGLAEPLRELARSGVPMFGTCAGLIMFDREHLGLMDIVARRNAFGRQVHSFEEELRFPDLDDEPVRAVFIRAPWIEEHGAGVEILASVDGHPVAAREGGITAIAFHPELSGDRRLHERFLDAVRARRRDRGAPCSR